MRVLRGLRTRDEGAPALEYIILAALILVAVVAMATYVVSRIVNYQNHCRSRSCSPAGRVGPRSAPAGSVAVPASPGRRRRLGRVGVGDHRARRVPAGVRPDAGCLVLPRPQPRPRRGGGGRAGGPRGRQQRRRRGCRANEFLAESGGQDVLLNSSVAPEITAEEIRITVSGNAITLMPVFDLSVTQTAAGPVERFTSRTTP